MWDLQATNPAARAALWEFLFGVDLIVSITATNLPPDEPLRFLLADLAPAADRLPHRLGLGASARRRRAARGAHVLDVGQARDRGRRSRRSAGAQFALDGGPDGAQLRRSRPNAAPDLTCSRATFGALSLGGNSWATLAAAGAVDEHTAGALAHADAMFATAPAARDVSWF